MPGQRYRLPSGEVVEYNPQTNGSARLSAQDRNALNEMNRQAAEADEIMRQYDEAERIVRRLRTGPWRGAMLSAAIPEAGGGIPDTVGGVAIGGPARLTGAITAQDVRDFNALRALQANRVLSEQQQQRGVQTDSDAARMMLAEIDPWKDEDTNYQIIARGRARSRRVRQRANFYAQWASQNGSLSATVNGQGVEQAFIASVGGGTGTAGRPTVRRIN